MITDDIFELVSYDIDEEAHIRVNTEVCQKCTHKACTFTCPARCYQWNEERGRIDFAYRGMPRMRHLPHHLRERCPRLEVSKGRLRGKV